MTNEQLQTMANELARNLSDVYGALKSATDNLTELQGSIERVRSDAERVTADRNSRCEAVTYLNERINEFTNERDDLDIRLAAAFEQIVTLEKEREALLPDAKRWRNEAQPHTGFARNLTGNNDPTVSPFKVLCKMAVQWRNESEDSELLRKCEREEMLKALDIESKKARGLRALASARCDRLTKARAERDRLTAERDEAEAARDLLQKEVRELRCERDGFRRNYECAALSEANFARQYDEAVAERDALRAELETARQTSAPITATRLATVLDDLAAFLRDPHAWAVEKETERNR